LRQESKNDSEGPARVSQTSLLNSWPPAFVSVCHYLIAASEGEFTLLSPDSGTGVEGRTASVYSLCSEQHRGGSTASVPSSPRPDSAHLFFAVPSQFLASIFSSLLQHTSFSRIRFSGHILCSFSQVSPAPPPFFHQHRSNIMSTSFGVTTSPAHCNV
jgi:hypothetical protein